MGKGDPKKPRGKMSSYAFFVQTCREEHKKKHPDASVNFSEFSKKCSERWKTMSAKEKGKFEDMAKADKARYEREMKTYIPPKGETKKKFKDPNAPKRPPSAFFLFCSEYRPKIKGEHPGLSIGDVAKKLGEMWNNTAADDKQPYEKKAAKLKEKYEKDIAAYRAKGKPDAAKKGVVKAEKSKKKKEEEDDKEDEEDEEESDVREQTLPEMKKGSSFPIESIKLTSGKTKPPAPFNEATLLSAMENPVKYMESRDAKAIKTLGETGGLGTVATRADIIDKLFHTFLMEKRGKDIFITSKAKQLLELVPEDLKKPELTASWEMKLSGIAKGTMKKENFLRNIREYTQEIVGEIKTGDGTFRHENLTNKKCPVCGKRMLAVNGKNSKMLVCQDRECGHRETVSRITNARCPKCHKKMEMFVKGEEETFICACGYKEKLSAFKSRREKEGAGVNKKDVQRYLNKQKKEAEAPMNNAFADAFAKLNLK